MPSTLIIYWLPEAACRRAIDGIREGGGTVTGALLTACQALKATPETVIHVPPAIWRKMCFRQGSWYRASARAGQHMLATVTPLPNDFEDYRDAEIAVSDFRPERLPSNAELERLVATPEYRDGKPEDWEKVKKYDSILFKLFFTLNGIWRKGDNLARHWLGHRANHANFLARRYTTEIDGERVPYSVTENARVCSSCAEYFNLVSPDSRKLVRACPGSVTIGGARRDVYYDVRPVGKARVSPGRTERAAPAGPAEASIR